MTGTKVNSFEIQHIITGAVHDVHASRLKMYADDSLLITEEMVEHIANQDIYLAVEQLVQQSAHQARLRGSRVVGGT